MNVAPLGSVPAAGWPDAPLDPPDIREALRALLLSQLAITSLIQQRVLPIARPPKSQLPCLTYTVVTNNSRKVKGGRSNANRALVTIEAWSLALGQAVRLKNAVETAFDNPPLCSLDIDIPWVEKRDERDLSHDLADGSGDRVFRIALDFFVKHTTP